MIQLKKEMKETFVTISAKIPMVDRDILIAIGDGHIAKGLRTILSTFREDLQTIIENDNKSKKIKKGLANGNKS